MARIGPIPPNLLPPDLVRLFQLGVRDLEISQSGGPSPPQVTVEGTDRHGNRVRGVGLTAEQAIGRLEEFLTGRPAGATTAERTSELPRHEGKVLGFREWKLDGYKLTPLVSQAPWVIGPNKAVCMKGSRHAAPAADCECGLYALHEPQPVWLWQPGGVGTCPCGCGRSTPRDDPPMRASIVGAILAWGELEVHATGFRAEYAEPVVFAYNEDTMPYRQVVNLMSIGEEMGLPVVPVHELYARAREFGDVVPEELRPTEGSFDPVGNWYAQGGVIAGATALPQLLWAPVASSALPASPPPVAIPPRNVNVAKPGDMLEALDKKSARDRGWDAFRRDVEASRRKKSGS